MGWCRVVKGPVVKQLQLRGSGFGTLQHLGPDDSAVVRQPLWHCAVAPSQSLCCNASVPPTACLPPCLLLPRAHPPPQMLRSAVRWLTVVIFPVFMGFFCYCLQGTIPYIADAIGLLTIHVRPGPGEA